MATSHHPAIFVSSVCQELIPYRQAALDAVWRCEYYPTGIERGNYVMPFSTSVSSLRMVDEAAVYVGIFSHRYGTFTIEELRRAQEQGIPILPFVSAEPLNDQDHESDPERARLLEELKQELRRNYVVTTFASAEELGSKVYRSLVALRDGGKLPQPDNASTPPGREPIVIPTPPAPYYAHPYVLDRSGFIGRRTELAQLDAWACATEPVLVMEGISAAGKSALAWEWVQTRMGSVLPRLEGLMWWSFYESNATMGTFLARALAYLSERSEDASASLSRPQQEEQLLALLAERQIVVVLDGLERLLVAYHGMYAPQPAEVVESKRACIDPFDGAFLRALTRCAPSKILVTTRLVPADLQDKTGRVFQGVRDFQLHGLSADDAIALMEHAGVHGTRALMRTFLAQFGDDALTVQVFAGSIRAYRPAPGDFDAWYQAKGRNLQPGAGVLKVALADIDPAILHFLSQMAAFRYGVDYATLVALNPFTEPLQGELASSSHPVDGAETRQRSQADASVGRLHRALTELEERGLLVWDRARNRYDLHPVVRAYAYARLEDKVTTFARIRAYLGDLPPEQPDRVQDITDLQRTLEIYHALVQAEAIEDAIYLYRDQLNDTLFYVLGAYYAAVELLIPLFPDGFGHSPKISGFAERSFIINALALAFQHLKEFAQAERLYTLAMSVDLQRRDAFGMSLGLQNLGEAFRHAGKLAMAEKVLLLCRRLAETQQDPRLLDESNLFLIDLHTVTGAREEATIEYDALRASPDRRTKDQALAYVVTAAYHFAGGTDPKPELAQALERARNQRHLFAEREALRLQGEIALAKGDLALVERAWVASYEIAQRQDQPRGPYLANLARLRMQQGNEALARELIDEALIRGGQGVELAASEVYLALADRVPAVHHALLAYEEAWADGPPYAFARELVRARAVLAALELPEPQLPPFDATRLPPIPYEDKIRALLAVAQSHSKESDPSALDESGLGISSERQRGDDERDPGILEDFGIRAPAMESKQSSSASGAAATPAEDRIHSPASAPVAPAKRRRPWWLRRRQD